MEQMHFPALHVTKAFASLVVKFIIET